MTPCCALSATLDVCCVLTTMPSDDRHRARGLRLGHRADVALAVGHRDVDEALAARPDRVEQRVVAEARDLDADGLGGPDDEGALGRR